MSGERIGGGILLALVVALTVAILLLGIELSLALKDTDQLSPTGSGALALAAGVLYAAAAWRGAQEGGLRFFFQWWGTMIAAHAGLGMLMGLFKATLSAAPFDGMYLLRWTGGISLPLVVLQVGYAIGISAVAYGNGRTAAAEPREPMKEPVARPAPEPSPLAEPVHAEEKDGAPHLEVYAAAIEKLRAQDHETLIRFAIQAAKCEGGLIATREGTLVAGVEVDGLEVERMAAVLPRMIRDLEQLSQPARPSTTMLHAAFGGYELLAVAGSELTGCLVGPQPGSRETAEVVLPVLVARAEALELPTRDEPAGDGE